MMLRALLAAMSAAAAAGIACAAPEPAPPLRVMTWNIHHGATTNGSTASPEQLAAVIRTQRPDLVALQEVDRHCSRSGGTDQAAELGRLTGMHALFAKATDEDGGESGLALLSRFPTEDIRILPLPKGDTTRIVLIVRVATPAGPLGFACTQLDAGSATRRLAQAQIVSSAILGESRAAVLAGDLHDPPDTPVMNVFAQAPWTPVPASTTTEIPRDGNHIVVRGLHIHQGTSATDATGFPAIPKIAAVTLPQ